MTYWIAAVVLTALNAGCLALNLLMMPGNWLMVVTLCLFLLLAGDPASGPDWGTLMIVTGLAAAGELIEMLAGSAKAARAGASRRTLLLSLVLSFAGSIVGSVILTALPVIGTAIGAVVGAAAGAWLGAWLGEAWVGSNTDKRMEVSRAAMTGRLWGLTIKLVAGAAIFVVQLVSLWM